MKAILSIQSHVVYGYVGNKASTYPLQSMGFDVWPVNTVQFSNHTGYGKWRGNIFSKEHIYDLINGIFDIGEAHKCAAILTGYMGSREICEAVKEIVMKFRDVNKDIIYLCDPVIGNTSCYVKPEVLEFFKNELSADIITPNQYEAEVLSGIKIKVKKDLIRIADYFHGMGVKIVIVTGIKLINSDYIYIFASDMRESYIIETIEYRSDAVINGTGDLFSSTFLGSYLKHNDIALALQYATFYLQVAVKTTIDSGAKELKVLDVNYNEQEEALPKISHI